MTDHLRDRIEEAETLKYRTMWSQPEYRINSPGENIIPRVWQMFGEPDHATATDYGAGEGRVITWLEERGASVNGFDLVPLHPNVELGCLWKLDREPSTEFGVCFDVLEHVPEQYIPDSLAVLRDRSTIAVAITIATVPCTCGKRHGLKLHETVRPVEWWNRQVGKVFTEWERHSTNKGWRWLYIGWIEQ